MQANHRAGDISYYEELGVSPEATAEEIRDAFRALARMMHPDQQTDPHLKSIAERQMRKLNRIYSVLSDPERRRRYDEMAEDVPTALMVRPHPVIVQAQRSSYGVWLGAVFVGLALLGLLWWDNANSLQNRPREGIREVVREPRDTYEDAHTSYDRLPPARGDSLEVSRLRADLRAMEVERDAAIRELDNLRSARATRSESTAPAQLPAHAASAWPFTSATELPAVAHVAAAPAPAHALPVAGSTAKPALPPGLAGFWFYVRPSMGQENKNQELYPPEFIEATIVEANGVVNGRYRSRFQIVDRAISPDVNFTFRGPAGSAGPYTWVGVGGARGEVTLKLTSENQLRVEWTASELGSQQGLVSGTAVLKRRID